MVGFVNSPAVCHDWFAQHICCFGDLLDNVSGQIGDNSLEYSRTIHVWQAPAMSKSLALLNLCWKIQNCFSVDGHLYLKLNKSSPDKKSLCIHWLALTCRLISSRSWLPIEISLYRTSQSPGALPKALQRNAIYRPGLAVTCFPCFWPSLSGDFILSLICMNRDTRYLLVTFVYGKPVALTLASP